MGGICVGGILCRCGCKEVYRFPHITYPYSSYICSFLQQHPVHFYLFMFFVLVSKLLITPLSE